MRTLLYLTALMAFTGAADARRQFLVGAGEGQLAVGIERGGIVEIASVANRVEQVEIDLPSKEIEARYDPEFMRCLKADGGGSNPGMIYCAKAETERQDVRLNKAYKLALSRLTSVKKAHLRSSERKWIKRLDRRCQSDAASEEGGSLARVIYADCILDGTIKRTIWIEKY